MRPVCVVHLSGCCVRSIPSTFRICVVFEATGFEGTCCVSGAGCLLIFSCEVSTVGSGELIACKACDGSNAGFWRIGVSVLICRSVAITAREKKLKFEINFTPHAIMRNNAPCLWLRN